MCGAIRARLFAKSYAVEENAPASSIETQRFIANGFLVSERISAMTSLIALGAKPCAPNEPSPPKFETAAVSCCVANPPSGPWMMGYSIPRREVRRVAGQVGRSVSLLTGRKPDCVVAWGCIVEVLRMGFGCRKVHCLCHRL